VRKLGGAPTDDPWTSDAVWERFTDEVKVTKPDEEEAARLDVRRILTAWNAARTSTSAGLRELGLMALYRSDGLDVTGSLLDEIEGGWGRNRGGPFEPALADVAWRPVGRGSVRPMICRWLEISMIRSRIGAAAIALM
jgi:hypothetical protein